MKAYGRLLGLDEQQLLSLFDQMGTVQVVRRKPRVETRPQQFQRTGVGVVIGLGILFLLVVALWWLGREQNEATDQAIGHGELMRPDRLPQPVGGNQ